MPNQFILTVIILFFSAAAVQLIYWLFIFARIAWYNPQKINLTQHAVSVIIAARNELPNLQQLIPALLAQQYREFEIIVADDRSDDGTYDYLLELTQQEPLLRHVRVEQTPSHIHPKKFALTLGIKAAKYKLVLLIDADCMPLSNQWIAQMMQGLTPEKEIVLGVSLYERKTGFLNLFIRHETLYTAMQYVGFALGGAPYMGVGRNLLYTREIFLNNNGFNQFKTLTGGDDDLFVNQVATPGNTAAVYLPEAQTLSYPKTTWGEWYRQKKRHLSVSKYYKLKHQVLLALFNFSQLGFWVLGITAIGLGTWLEAVAAVFVSSLLLKQAVYYGVTKRLGDKQPAYYFPFLDLCYFVYYIVIGFVALTSKTIRWK